MYDSIAETLKTKDIGIPAGLTICLLKTKIILSITHLRKRSRASDRLRHLGFDKKMIHMITEVSDK